MAAQLDKTKKKMGVEVIVHGDSGDILAAMAMVVLYINDLTIAEAVAA
jgi:hypothetical protein